MRQEAVAAGAAPALTRLLSSPSRAAVAAAAAALRNASEHPRARRALSALLASLPPAQQVGGRIHRISHPEAKGAGMQAACGSPWPHRAGASLCEQPRLMPLGVHNPGRQL
jgi:hypothetical protein